MFDLSTLKINTFDMTLLDGTVLHVKKPTESIFLNITGLQNEIKTIKDDDVKGAYAIIDKTICLILNNNIEKRKFKVSEISGMFANEYDFKEQFINEYMKFVNKIKSNPNL